jgi:hypothetical protein
MIYSALQLAKAHLDKSVISLYDDYVYTILETTTKTVDDVVVSYADKVFRTYVDEAAAINMCRIFNHGLNGEGITVEDHDGTITAKTYSYVKNEIFREPPEKEQKCH